MLARLVGAIQFLTVVPLRMRGASAAESAVMFPVVGALIGLAGFGVLRAFNAWLSMPVAALLVVAFWSWISAALREDGPTGRIGTYGAVVLVLSIALRWQALVHLAVDPLPLFVAAQAIPRAAIVALAWIARPATSGSGAWMAASMSSWSAVGAIVLAIAAAFANGITLGSALVGVSAAVILAARRYFYLRLGGITADCLGAVCRLLEILTLSLATCRSCSW